MEGKYQAYPVYDQSGVEWLGKVPAHWRIKPLKYLTNFINGNAFKPSEWSESGTPIIRIENLNGGESFNFYEGAVSDRYRVNKGDLLFGWSGNKGTSFGPFIWWRDGQHYLNQHIYRLEGFNCHKRWFYWILKAATYYIEEQAHGIIGMIHVTKAKLGGICIPSITDEEQRTIAAFLDHETARIDRLIEKQQRLIELLKEKRQAVISHAVTKGLNPDAPMKDSGVEWLGQVPEHWIITRAKFLFKFVTSGSRGWAEYYSDEGELFFRIANLTRDTIRPKLESIQNVSPPSGAEGVRSRIRSGDLLVSITADLGSVCVADRSVSGGYVSQHVALARPNERVLSSDWLGYFILSDSSKEQLLGSGYGGTKIQLSLEDVRELCVALPPAEEQNKIANFLFEQLERFEVLMDKAQKQISLLQERRTALISAAVTGKIDVRSWQPDTSTQVTELDLPMAAEQAAEYRV